MSTFKPSEVALRRGEQLWGTPSARETTRAPKLIKFQPYRNAAGTMFGFASVQLASGMIVNDCRLMVSPSGKHWIATPAQKQLDRDGNPRFDVNGKVMWSPIVEFVDKATRDKFSDLVIRLIRRQHPEVFES